MRLIFPCSKKIAIDEIRGYTGENSGRNLMTPELIAIIAATVALAGLMLRQTNALRREINEKFAKVDEQFKKVDERFEKVDKRFEKVDERFKRLEDRMTQIEKQQAKLEGLLEGLREALTYNRAA